MMSRIFLCYLLIFTSRVFNHSMKSTVVIQAVLFALYVTGRLSVVRRRLKARGFLDFPMTNAGSFSVPSMLQASRTVSRSLECFPPVQVSVLKACVLSGNILQNIPVSSQLKILFGVYRSANRGHLSANQLETWKRKSDQLRFKSMVASTKHAYLYVDGTRFSRDLAKRNVVSFLETI